MNVEQRNETGEILFLSCIAPENVYCPDECCSASEVHDAYPIRHTRSKRRYLAFKARECRRSVHGESLESVLKRSMRTVRAPEQIVRPVDLVYLNEDGPYLVYPNRLDGEDWVSCKEYLPLYMEGPDEAGGEIARSLTEAVEELHNRDFALDGLDAEQIWVHRRTKQVYIYTGGVLPAERKGHRKDSTRPDLYTSPPRVWEQAKPYSAFERDRFSLVLLQFWLKLGFHPFASTEARRWLRWEDRCGQYHASPIFCCSQHPAFRDTSRDEFGLFSDEKELLRRWEMVPDEEKKMFCTVLEDVARQERSRNLV